MWKSTYTAIGIGMYLFNYRLGYNDYSEKLIDAFLSGVLYGDSLNISQDSVKTISPDSAQTIPKEFYLYQNYPNPFNPVTTIRYYIPKAGLVNLKVYDLLGREIAILINEEKPAGRYEVEFNGAGLPSGVYFYTLQSGNFKETKKFILMK